MAFYKKRPVELRTIYAEAPYTIESYMIVIDGFPFGPPMANREDAEAVFHWVCAYEREAADPLLEEWQNLHRPPNNWWDD